jgi:hypothetical protein
MGWKKKEVYWQYFSYNNYVKNNMLISRSVKKFILIMMVHKCSISVFLNFLQSRILLRENKGTVNDFSGQQARVTTVLSQWGCMGVLYIYFWSYFHGLFVACSNIDGVIYFNFNFG